MPDPATASTLANLEAAQAELARQRERQANYTGNNPAKFDTDVRIAFEQVRTMTQILKASGLLPRTAHEDLETRLDTAFPRARPREIVTFEGARYRRRVEPATRTASGQVSTWDRGWSLLVDDAPPDRPVA